MIDDRDDRALGVVLAGGLARRLGGAKATVQLGGGPLVSYALEALAAAGLEAVVVAKADTPLPLLDVPVWIEEPLPRHPAHGIACALERAGRPIVAVGCDTPFLPPPLLSALAELDVPLAIVESAQGLEPLPGRYSPSLAPSLIVASRGNGSLRGAVERLQPHRISVDELRRYGDPAALLLNVNTRDDLRRAETLLEMLPRQL